MSRKIEGHGHKAVFNRGCRCKLCQEASDVYNRENHKKNRTAIAARKRLKTYGLDSSAFRKILHQQGDRCAICRDVFDAASPTRKPQVDHDHVSGAIRGLLCGPCNRGIGLLRDDPNVLTSAAKYLLERGKQ